MYIFNLNKLEKGDILLINVDPRISVIMKEKTGSVFHHAMLYTGESSHIHSNKGPGVQAENTLRMLFQKADAAIALRLKDKENIKFIQIIVDMARSKVGTEYSGEEAKRTVLGYSDEEFEYNRQFCTRFVAQAYAEAGLNIVTDPNYCTPHDLNNSEHFIVIKDILREARKEDIAYANENDTPLHKQIEIHNQILAYARKVSETDIQTFNQLTSYLLSHPEHDEEISAFIEKSGYLDLWREDMEKNPAYYDFTAFSTTFEKEVWPSVSNTLANIASENTYRYQTNLNYYKEFYGSIKLRYLKMQIDLYEILVVVSEKMADVAKNAREKY